MNLVPQFSLRKRSGVLACLAFCLSSFVGFALAQPTLEPSAPPASVAAEKVTERIKPQPAHRAPRQCEWLDQLGLKPEKAEKVKAIMTQGHAESKALKQQLLDKRKALMQYLHSDAANEAQARSLNSDINDLQRKLSEVRLKTWFAMRAQLTQPQLQKLRGLKEKMRGGDKGATLSGGAGCEKLMQSCRQSGNNSLNETF